MLLLQSFVIAQEQDVLQFQSAEERAGMIKAFDFCFLFLGEFPSSNCTEAAHILIVYRGSRIQSELHILYAVSQPLTFIFVSI